MKDYREVAQMKQVFEKIFLEVEKEIKNDLLNEDKEEREKAYYTFRGMKRFNESMNTKIARLTEGLE